MAENTWTLHDSAPASLAPTFSAPASPSTAVYWGGPVSMAFAAAGQAITGAGSTIIAAPALAAASLEAFTGTATEAFRGPTLAASGAETVAGAGAETYAVSALNGAGLETFSGIGLDTIGGPALAGAALNALSATGAVVIASPAFEAAGLEQFNGTGAAAFSSSPTGEGAEAFTGPGAMALAAPSLEGGVVQPVDGSGANAVQAPTLLGYGLGAPEPAFEVVGLLGYPVRYQPIIPEPTTISGTGRLTVHAPRHTARGTQSIVGIGSIAKAAPEASGDAQQAVRAAGAMTAGLDVSGTGAVMTRRITSTTAAHPRREISGAGTAELAPHVTGTGHVQPPDPVDREWTVLQRAHKDETLSVVLT